MQASVNQALLENFNLAPVGDGTSAADKLRGLQLNRIPFPAYKNNTFALVIKGVRFALTLASENIPFDTGYHDNMRSLCLLTFISFLVGAPLQISARS